MRVVLEKSRKSAICETLIGFYKSEFDEDLSEFRAEELVEFMHKEIGPSLYNQAIQDARKFVSEKLDDLDTEFYMSDEL
ncbi:hypothetical protein NBRC116602_24910 [Hyphomicrobiales bacterium 4NK60-0047b]|jgi:uncharacterized protein (DUF2164 family)